jgi:transcriptional regulator with XRE-family HTH domain
MKLAQEAAESIANRIAVVRRESTLSQAEFARRLGYPLRTYLSWERDEARPPVELLRRVYVHFKVDAAWLLTGDGNMASGPDIRDYDRLEGVLKAVADIAMRLGHKVKIEGLVRLARPILDTPRDHQATALAQLEVALGDYWRRA